MILNDYLKAPNPILFPPLGLNSIPMETGLIMAALSLRFLLNLR